MMPAVLRDPPLGDVDVGHDLQPGDHAGLDRLAATRIDLVQHAVDAEPHPQVVLGRLEVDVGGAVLDRLRDQQVDVPDDRRVVDDRRQVATTAGLVLGAQVVGHVAEVAVLALQPVDDPAQLAAGDHHRPDGHAGGGADVVQRHHVARVGDADDELVVVRSAMPSTRCRSTSGSGIFADRRRVDRDSRPGRRVLMPYASADASVSCSSVTTWSLIRTARIDRPLRSASSAARSTACGSAPRCFSASKDGMSGTCIPVCPIQNVRTSARTPPASTLLIGPDRPDIRVGVRPKESSRC